MEEAIVIGCGLSGAVTARFLAEEMDKKVTVLERRKHIGGNMFDYRDDVGILVHQYGPHTFHTNKKELMEYMKRFAEWEEYYLTCGSEINGRYTPTPFNFQTIDDFYTKTEAEHIKAEIHREYGVRPRATVVEMLESKNNTVKEYAQFLFENDYRLYTAKQWGISPEEIDISVLKRVPLEFSYNNRYFMDTYQYIPKISYVNFFENLLKHPNIEVKLDVEAMEHLQVDVENAQLKYDGEIINIPVIYTGAIDEILEGKYGRLPYRSLRFEWKTLQKDSYQNAPVVAYPQEPGYIRITEYKKLPIQEVTGVTTIAVEYSLPYEKGKEMEPYYPIPNEENQKLYNKYKNALAVIPNLYLCGRLADYRYYNMDQALESALNLCKVLKNRNYIKMN